MAGLDQTTGRLIRDGWLHTVQSIGIILTTRFGERVERRHIGSILPHLLGENLTAETWLRFMAGIPQDLAVIEFNGLAREPRFDLKVVSRYGTTPETARQGRVGLSLQGIYRPNGHRGDPTPEGVRRLNVLSTGTSFITEAA